jgi:hypothetical protein
MLKQKLQGWYQRLKSDNFKTTLICTLTGTFVGAGLALTTTQHFQEKAEAKERQRVEARAKEDMRQYLDILKAELEDNNHLLRSNEKKYNTQSLFFLEYHRSGFEMLRNSGAMRQIEDKTLLSSIWKIYANLEELKQAHEYYLNKPLDGSAIQKQYKKIEVRIDNMVTRLDSLLQAQ